MICPQCGKRNSLGVQRCRFCHRQFTRSASQSQSRAAPQPGATPRAPVSAQQGFDPRPPDRRHPIAPVEQPVWEDLAPDSRPAVHGPTTTAASYPTRPTPARRKSPRSGCLLAFGVISILLVGGLVALLLASTMIVQPMIRDAAVAEIGSGVRDEVTRQIDTQIGESLSGDVVISEAEINQRLSGDVDLGPISAATVQITPDGLLIRLRAYGMDGSYRAQVIDQDGSVAIAGSPMEGPLAYLMPEGELEDAVNTALAAAISDAGYYVEQVATAEGAITLTLSQ